MELLVTGPKTIVLVWRLIASQFIRFPPIIEVLCDIE